MEKTTNYQLPKWEKSDFIKMDDFNDAFGKLDAALKAGADAQTALQEVVNAVKSTAESAYAPENKPYTAGSYTGNGGTQTIKLGFKPSFLVIADGIDSGRYTGSHSLWMGTPGQIVGDIANVLSITNTGFSVTDSRYNTSDWPALWLNTSGNAYSYIAFR